MPGHSSVSLQCLWAICHCSPGYSFGQKVQVVRVVKGWRGGGPGACGDQVSRVFHAVTGAQVINEPSVYSGAFTRQCAGSLGNPRPEILNLLVDVLYTDGRIKKIQKKTF